jgi:hypothetical protein
VLKKKYIIGMLLTILGLATTLSITIAPSAIPTEDDGKPRKQIPFVGMTLSYQVYTTGASPHLFNRMVTFYADLSEPEYMWVRDSENLPDDLGDDRVAKIDINTRIIVDIPPGGSPSGDVQTGGYSEALFPTNLHVGDEVTAYWGGTVTIVGTQKMSVMGEGVNAWIAYTHTDWDANYIMYYEKKTGIWLGGNVVWYDGETLNSWAMHLVSTNVSLEDD